MRLLLILLNLILPTIHGAYNPAVTQATIHKTICVVGWTGTIRPSENYTYNLKVKQIAALHYIDTKTSSYEEDHFVPLELGGSPTSVDNLWPEPWAQANKSDPMENYLHSRVCSGKETLRQARNAIKVFKFING